MSVRNLGSTLPVNLPEAIPAALSAPWIRNPSWLALTPVGSSDQMFRGLLAVFPDSTFTAFTAAGDYTVDWGDGTSNNYTSGATALKQYDFNDVDLANTNAPVTLTDAGDLVERTAHGYNNGMEVRFYNIVTTTGLTAGQTYYVINATANNFQIAAMPGGSAIALTNNGSATLLPYKQAIVTVTPQAGQNLTAIDLNVRHTQTGLQAYDTGWLDIEVGSPNFTSTGLVIAANSVTENVNFNSCERVAVRNFGGVTDLSNRFRTMRSLQKIEFASMAAVTNMSSMFANCTALSAIPPMDTAAVTNTSSMFANCASLQSVALFNTSLVTDMSGMFASCFDLQSVPLFNTSSVTNMTSMFSVCRSLKSVPLFNTSSVTNMFQIFNNCFALQSVPLFNTSSVTNMGQMFFNCTALQTVPLFNTAAVTNMSNMFQNTTSLQAVPLFNTAAVTSMANMFFNCFSLQFVPLFNTAAVTNMSGMLGNCLSLQNIPLFNTSAVTNMSNMFSSCFALQSVPALVTTAVTSSGNFTNMFSGCTSLSRIEAKDFRFSFSVAGCKLSATALNEIYTNLPVVVGQTITVSNNWGTATDNPAIATAKGWTVVG